VVDVSQVDARLAALEALPDSDARDLAVDVIQGLMELYGAGLARIVELAPEVVDPLCDDELVGHLLLLHDLHPVDPIHRVETALDGIRPYLATHGGNVELLSVSEGVAHLRLAGTCHGCPSSLATLKDAIEAAIFKAAPDITRVDAEGVAPVSQVISLESLVCPVR
jgi:Fe-S cluster biogenesis protein NfuA